MSKLENKTKPNARDIYAFLQAVEPAHTREDCLALHRLMEETTGYLGVVWGSGIIGYSTYHYRYESGREGDWFIIGFAPRKSNITIYLMQSAVNEYASLISTLGKYKMGKGCIYIKRLADIDTDTLRTLIRQATSYASR